MKTPIKSTFAEPIVIRLKAAPVSSAVTPYRSGLIENIVGFLLGISCRSAKPFAKDLASRVPKK